MANNTSQHILSTSANLLGFCLIVITSLRIADLTENHMIDESTSIIALLLMFSCGFSFFSIRTNNKIKEANYENIAEYFFIGSLIGILIIILLITFNFFN